MRGRRRRSLSRDRFSAPSVPLLAGSPVRRPGRSCVALAFVGFFLNLFNLIPIVPLDGGRAAGALHPALWFVGLLLMVGLVVVRPNPILVLIVVIGGIDLWNRWRARGDAGDYYRLSVGQRVTVAVVYLGLVAALGLAMSLTHVERTF